MPIKRKDFIKGNFKTSYRSTKEHPLAIFLKKNKKEAFRVDELTKAVNMKEDTVRSMLGVLRSKKKIIHKTPYFAWK